VSVVPSPYALLRQAQRAIARVNTYRFVADLKIVAHAQEYRATYQASGDLQQNPYKMRAQVTGSVVEASSTSNYSYTAVRIRRRGWIRSSGKPWRRSRVGHTLSALPSDPYGSFPSLHSAGNTFSLGRLFPLRGAHVHGFTVWHLHGVAHVKVGTRSVPEIFDEYIRKDTRLPILLRVSLHDAVHHTTTVILQSNSNFGERVSILPPA
jgi:hypothetical protein